MADVKTRFAPSPTGYLHIGNARAALFCWLYARAHGGTFLLRIDDTDKARSRDDYATAIEEDLSWLGLSWDESARQSTRFARYDAVFAQLKQKGLIYACYETPDELERKRKRQLARGLPPVYDRAALALDDAEKESFAAEGRAPHWRFKLSGDVVRWQDGVRGEQIIETTSISDPVFMRADGTYLYTLPSVIDDIDFAISHIIRGEDHVTNTAVQIELFKALEAPIPEFAHFSLLLSAQGEGLSKRDGVLSLRDMRAQGIEAMSINSLIARLGTADAIRAESAMQKLIDGFDLSRLGRAAARFDMEDIKRLNAKLLHDMAYADIAPRLKALGVEGDEVFWQAICGNVSVVADAKIYADIIYGKITPHIAPDDQAFLTTAANSLPTPLKVESWREWTHALKASTGRTGKGLFMPLRLALTGLPHGPEMQNILPLIGYEKARARLQGDSA